MNGPTLLNLLRTGDIEPLHAHLTDLQAQYEAGQISEGDLLRAFTAFQTSDLTLGEGFQKWTEIYPSTYAPHVALAGWFLGRGWEARGQGTSNHVSDQGWRAMDHFLTQADGCSRHAATLTANPLAAWNVTGLASNARGCQLCLNDVQTQQYPDWFTRAVQDNPGTLALRRVMLLHLRTEWGGSEEHMLTFVRQQQDAGLLSQTDVQRLWAEFHSRVSHHALAFADEPSVAVERARIAAELHPLEAEQLFIALTRVRGSSEARLAALQRYLDAALQEHAKPGRMFGWALSQARDWIVPETSRLAELLTRAAQSGDIDSAIMLGEFQIQHPKWDLPDARPLLRQARDQGHTEAAELLVEFHESTFREALKDTPQKREDILKAADLLSGDMSWRVYSDFDTYQTQFGLDARQQFRYLHRAADSGNNKARFELARQLRAGNVELGDDGVLRPVDTQPIQASLDYARYLLQRAALTDHAPSRKILEAMDEHQWQEGRAQRLNVRTVRPDRFSLSTESERHSFRGYWYLGVLLILVLFRVFDHLGDGSFDPRTLRSQRAESAEHQRLMERVAAGELQPVFEKDGVHFEPVTPKSP
ncbi:sel1 repeat family protein [Deinococcus sp. JMULE3]|uniref:sel1 repeat family protein n=1 Tax=Deinococcus sp. JMULE3 TaxID=2518341 RepID=UPI001575E0B5|nr:sel1 repeat family protein [Deinococcus sp. JMULE3]NTX99887.1 sel1 repeat family protein [Deinococcus sp. JMULE3]